MQGFFLENIPRSPKIPGLRKNTRYERGKEDWIQRQIQKGRRTVGQGFRAWTNKMYNFIRTTDPDGDSMSYLWFQYPEPGSYKGLVSFRPYASNLYDLHVTAPEVDGPRTIHFILKVTDKGTPPLTRYKRVIVTVLP